MALSDIASRDLLQKLSKDLHNEELLQELHQRIKDSAYAKELEQATLERAGDEENPSDGPPKQAYPPTGSGELIWHNCIGEQICHPRKIERPETLQSLVDAVKEGKEQGWQVRMVGSGHSFSDVAPTEGLLLNPYDKNSAHRVRKTMDKVLDMDTSLLKHPELGPSLFSVESGIHIKALNEELDKRHLALINMGAYDGQTLAGALLTGTHGTGLGLGPMASSVRSLVLVSENGITYQIEPQDGITDPVKFATKQKDIVLKQDDDWFYSSVIAMGCMGLIYSYTLEVMPAYFLEESRTRDKWEVLKQRTGEGSISRLLTENRHFEVDINPYAVAGNHECVKIVRNCHEGPARGDRGVKNYIAGLLAECHIADWALVKLLNTIPTICPKIINQALHTLVDNHYIDKSFRVMNIGKVDDVKALALELSFDATNVENDAEPLVQQIDKLLAVFAQFAQMHWYLAGPVALRFVKAADAYLAPQAGRNTCMVELDLLVGIKHGEDLLKDVKKAMCTPGSGVRVHWGLDLDTVTGDEVRDMFPMYDRWLGVYRQLNSTGRFDSKFTERLGISMAKS